MSYIKKVDPVNKVCKTLNMLTVSLLSKSLLIGLYMCFKRENLVSET